MIRFIQYEFRSCLHCEAHYVKDCPEKVIVNNIEKVPVGCWREDLIRDKPKEDDKPST